MPKFINCTQTAFALAALLAFTAGSAHATHITFTYTGSGTGRIGTTNFYDTAFTFNQFADTNDIVGIAGCDGCLSLAALSATVTLDGVGTYAFTTATRTFYNNGAVGFGRDAYTDLYNIFAVGTTYRLDSSIGPAPLLAGAPGLLQWGGPAVITSEGVLYFSELTAPGTFEASVVPIPAAGWLLGSGLAGLVGLGRKRRNESVGQV